MPVGRTKWIMSSPVSCGHASDGEDRFTKATESQFPESSPRLRRHRHSSLNFTPTTSNPLRQIGGRIRDSTHSSGGCSSKSENYDWLITKVQALEAELKAEVDKRRLLEDRIARVEQHHDLLNDEPGDHAYIQKMIVDSPHQDGPTEITKATRDAEATGTSQTHP
uniref:ARAD1D45408p n=1 Tax=Blastobotrys adeninivorans TaxID=409370 RepID=A0A060TDN1_BLAAD